MPIFEMDASIFRNCNLMCADMHMVATKPKRQFPIMNLTLH